MAAAGEVFITLRDFTLLLTSAERSHRLLFGHVQHDPWPCALNRSGPHLSMGGCSPGSANGDLRTGDTLDTILQRADEALYRPQREGRTMCASRRCVPGR